VNKRLTSADVESYWYLGLLLPSSPSASMSSKRSHAEGGILQMRNYWWCWVLFI